MTRFNNFNRKTKAIINFLSKNKIAASKITDVIIGRSDEQPQLDGRLVARNLQRL